MTTATKTLLSTGEAARELRALEHHVRRVMRPDRPYVVRAGRYYLIAPQDLPKLAADLRAAGYLPAVDAETEVAADGPGA